MILVGMPDSPYVRRVAISLKRMGIPFEHQQVSVFRHFDRFKAINPVVKAPSFVCDDGTVLMDSSLILDHIESTAPAAKRLMPAGVMERREALRLIGLAMAACEKGVQVVYEKQQRPAEKLHVPWMDRIVAQGKAAYGELERAAAARPDAWLQGEALNAADIAVACAWRFGQFYNSVEIPAAGYPALVAHSMRAEALPEFVSTPLD